MADAHPVLGFVAAFGQDRDLLDAVPGLLAESGFGTVVLTSERFRFVETDYYTATMGGELWKQLFACDPCWDASSLAERKRRTIALEASMVGRTPGVARPLNLDPGYLDLGKVVLASTKEHAHRLYLSQGIFAEVTLRFQRQSGRYEPLPWTYPDYQRPDVGTFLLAARERFRQLSPRRSPPPAYDRVLQPNDEV